MFQTISEVSSRCESRMYIDTFCHLGHEMHRVIYRNPLVQMKGTKAHIFDYSL